MNPFVRSAATLAAAAVVFAPALAGADSVGVLILKEHGVGSAAQVQPYVDKLVAASAKSNGWSNAKGQYHTTRSAAETWIKTQKPHFGIFSLAAFLAFQSKHSLEPIGKAMAGKSGGGQYYFLSKTATNLATCRGKRLATDHADDTKFIEGVVAGGKFKLSEFTLVQTTQPTEAIRKVVAGEADCALIDDAQYAEIRSLPGAEGLKRVWESAQLPSLVIVAFPAAPSVERKVFQGNFGKVCEGDSRPSCKEVGLHSFIAAALGDFSTLIAAYR